MQFSLIRTLSEFDQLANEWNTLLAESASHVPFLRHEYLRNWWTTLGGGEWQKGDLAVITARSHDGQLAGAAPLFLTENRDGVPALLLLGSIEISDYLDVISPSELLPQFLGGLLDFLAAQTDQAYHFLDWYNLIESSPAVEALHVAAQARGWQFSQEPLQPCPYIPLAGDWETYLAGIDKKQRHEIRRKLRRAEQYSQPVRWYCADAAETLDAEIESFFELMAYDTEKEKFLTQPMRQQMRTAIWEAFKQKTLQLAFLLVGDEKAAAYLNFDYGNRIWVYNSGFNPRFRELSVGWVLLAYLLQWSIENGRDAFDFMRGDEAYKYRFGAVNRYICRVKAVCGQMAAR